MMNARLQEALPNLAGLGAIVRFDFGDDGVYTIDARAGQPTLSESADGEADCTIRISTDNLKKLIDGQLDPMIGYTFGKIKVAGSLGIAMKLVNAIS
ncbi:SCP2 sterol-binding domain-containing protein [Elstera cyanobacteriorum]|uniref:Sterol-binding protein n=1 Tax=Elstera cyanobacteriorum TaxID=2022747 RepID=A0A255XMK7_9PROT|nr:SCP2 sterol-binding domain-containing protein [Elstera cyanobacteriorum]MCK6441175.1 SCP2 sterol-binding domain-containing protein [Elstera cyanobacteriorum]OYQ18142.1 sterol-binding protein [Elstera cyanobacteriorum]